MAVPSESSLPPPGFNTLVAENWCYSRVKAHKFTYMWGLNNFSLRHLGVGKCITSSEFSSIHNDVLKWCLKAYPNGYNENSKDYLSLFLALVSSNDQEVGAKFKFAILNDKRKEAYKIHSQKPERFIKGGPLGYPQFIKRDFLLNEANGVLPGDTLTIFCEVTVVSDNENLTGQSNAVQSKVPECRLSEDLGTLLENRRFSDVTLSVKGKKFQAHKAILAARSPVFAAMFEHDMKERKRNIVNITDIHHKVIQEMLSFIYTGRVSSLENIAQDLLPAADKYALERLKVMCEDALCKSLSVDKVLDVLILADLHSASQLKTQAIRYINMHAAEVMKTQGWGKLNLSHPQLTIEVLRVMAMQQITLGEPSCKRVKQS